MKLETVMKKKALLISAIAVTTVLAGGWAVAQSVHQRHGGFGPPFMHGKGGEGMGHGMMKGPDMMKGMGHRMKDGGPELTFADPAHIDALKAELAITPAQEPAWTKYAKAIQDAAATLKTTREDVAATAVSKMSPSDRFAFVTKMREQRQKQIGTVKAAAEELLGTLNATQKVKATDILPGLAFGLGPMRGADAGDHRQHKH
jgi:LTXXQ motif family protein